MTLTRTHHHYPSLEFMLFAITLIVLVMLHVLSPLMPSAVGVKRIANKNYTSVSNTADSSAFL